MNRVIVIGAGNWGKNLVRTFHEIGALAGVAEASAQLRDELATSYPGVPLYEDYKEALQTDVPAVAIATPVPTHYTIAKEAIVAGKDVFVEKPMTLSVAEAESLEQLAAQHQRVLMVGHLLLYQPTIQRMKSLLDEGVIGQLKSLHQERSKLGRVRAVENVLWSFGVHDIAVLLYLTGATPTEVQAYGQRIVQPDIEDDVYLHLRFEGNVQAHLHTSWLWPEVRRSLTAIGTEGMLVYDEVSQTLTLHRKGIQSDLSNRDEGAEIVMKADGKPLTLECEHFLSCIRDRKRPISDGANGIAVVRILEQASLQLSKK